MDRFTQAYIECALWSSTDGGGEPLDAKYSLTDFAPDTLTRVQRDCKLFQEQNPIPQYQAEWPDEWPADWPDEEMAGHDFFLTRNRHGAGYWDRGLGDVGDRLTKAAHAFGEFDLYVGDDGRIYGI